MYERIRTPAMCAILATLTMAGCDNGTEPRAELGDLDPSAVVGSIDPLSSPIQGLIAPTAAIRAAFPTLVDEGLSFDRDAAAGRTLAAVRPTTAGVAADVIFPEGMLGETLTTEDGENWAADSERTDAPADGVRVIWYGTDGAGEFLFPLNEGGYIDLSDADDGGTSQIGLRMVDTSESEPVVLAEFIEGIETSGDTEWTTLFTAAGFYGGGSHVVDFDLTYDESGSETTGDEQLDFTATLDGSAATYTFSLNATEEGGSEAGQEVIAASVQHSGVTTEITLTADFDADGNQTGSGTLSHGGNAILQVTLSATGFQYADADGQTLSGAQASAVDGLVQALFLTGINVLVEMPRLFL